ncbi:hypothetical protein V6S67_18135 [Arthrobacter sp. Soc17.1.1.1]|uniref:hypothetical protein n=1 Tax=Arthrobacter sp. Soc17.1.1.1 TaxID=3121277 RepID=UPI002FE4811D
MGAHTASHVLVVGVVLLSVSACTDVLTAEKFEACMAAEQHAISASIDGGADPEQTYQQAMDDCGYADLTETERDELFNGP